MTTTLLDANPADIVDQVLYTDIKSLIGEARQRVSYVIDNTLTLLHWRVGNRIKQEVLQNNKRADYGQEIITNLAKVLAVEFGAGFGRTNLFYMLRFAEAYPDEKNVHMLSGQLRWTH